MVKLAKYRPATVTAIQYDGSKESADSIRDWIQHGNASFPVDTFVDVRVDTNDVKYLIVTFPSKTLALWTSGWLVKDLYSGFQVYTDDEYKAKFVTIGDL